MLHTKSLKIRPRLTLADFSLPSSPPAPQCAFSIMATKFVLLTLTLYSLADTLTAEHHPTETILRLRLGDHLSLDPSDLHHASLDFGTPVKPTRPPPLAVLRPLSADDVVRLVRAAYESPRGFAVAARGHGHSVNGQAHAGDGGVVVRMGSGSGPESPRVSEEGGYVDAWGGELWIDVLKATLEHGLAPLSWTDYLYLSVGGTLSVGGISGEAFRHGPQISNVLELDVVTGKGDKLTCSEDQNQELFHAVLGGLGQFGIITRARIALEPAPDKVRWIRVLYSKFEDFTKDQEYLISLHGEVGFDYVEGFVIVAQGLINNWNWRSSFFSSSNPVKISSFSGARNENDTVLYCLEVTRNYRESEANSIDQEVESVLKKLSFIESSVFTTDLAYVDFLDRVHKAELKLRSKGLWDVPHPWLNLFVPRSRIADFDNGVFKGILGNNTSGPILVYPMTNSKWDRRSSAVTPEEDVFYLVALLRSAVGDTLDHLNDENRRILRFCRDEGIRVKQYIPYYTTEQEWRDHFGDKWARFNRRKMEFDPRRILAPGQRIFEPSLEHPQP